MMRMVINIDHLLKIMNNKYLSLIFFSNVCLIYHHVKSTISTCISISPTYNMYIIFHQKWLHKIHLSKSYLHFHNDKIRK